MAGRMFLNLHLMTTRFTDSSTVVELLVLSMYSGKFLSLDYLDCYTVYISNIGVKLLFKNSVLWCCKKDRSVYGCHWRTTFYHSKMVLVSVCVFQKYILGPKGSPAKWLFSCWPQSYQYVCLLTLPYLSLDMEAELWMLTTACCATLLDLIQDTPL